VIPVVEFRDEYTYHKRLREIVPGQVYRSGQMTAAGIESAVHELHFKTILNVQEDVPDPDISLNYWSLGTIKESELCRQLGVKFVQIGPDLRMRRQIPEQRPHAIDEFLAVMDDESNYPVLIHCRAGLHRTGCLAAVYRMEYQGWSREEALHELRANGFGEWVSRSSNDYIVQYIQTFRPGLRRAE
jgi:protein tyrosine phosphatase (PTP) superfamily phosphohydrolase (DUF442 family)